MESFPSAEECQRRVEKFVEVTGTDEAIAQFYLQDREWELEPSVEAFYAENFQASNRASKRRRDSSPEEQVGGKPSESLKKPPVKFSFITWNLDGLSGEGKGLENRTKAAAEVILQRQIDVAFLQEVVRETYFLLKSLLGDFYLFSKKASEISCIEGEYFTIIITKKDRTAREVLEVRPFANSVMSRDLTLAQITFKEKVKFFLVNTHLESTKDYSEQRTSQLKQGFKTMAEADRDANVIFAGDLNLRDREEQKVGIPSETVDLWKALGSRPECRYTWDARRNSNIKIDAKFKPQCRFDRVYFRASRKGDVIPEHFGLVGIEKVKNSQNFPSDHWGIYCVFDVK